MNDPLTQSEVCDFLEEMGISGKKRNALARTIVEMDVDLTAAGINARHIFKKMQKAINDEHH